ncbi:MAG: hypothetical protein ACRDOM_11050 [Nocardioides sp.]
MSVASPFRAIRVTPYLCLAAGALLVLVPLVVEFVSGDAFALMGLVLLLVLGALPGLRRLQVGRDGRAGRWGQRLTFAGLAGMIAVVVSGDVLDAAMSGTAQAAAEAIWLVVAALATLGVLVGVVLFSVGMTRARVLDPRGIWIFLTGMVVGLAAESFEQSLAGPVPWLADVLPPLGFISAGVGLFVLGRSAQAVLGEHSASRVASPVAG